MTGVTGLRIGVVTYIVADSFDTLSQREQYEFIDKHGDNVYYVKKNITQQLIPQHSYYDSPIAEKMICYKKSMDKWCSLKKITIYILRQARIHTSIVVQIT